MSSLLEQQMTRYFEYVKPRHSNPTYSSFNVGSSMIMGPSLSTTSPPIPRGNKMRQLSHAQKQNPHNDCSREVASRRSNSHLSQYGSSALNFHSKNINQRDIFQKQQKKYDIISIQPKNHQETIKKYPKYHLEHSDQNYFKRLQLQSENKKLGNDYN